jgi:GTP-binding protein YchF
VALSVGIAGLPNVGKSTLLNALSHAHAAVSNYPFCTIDANVGVTAVPDADLARLAAVLEPEETIPATIRFVDVAGLVEGASRGEGLGNKFLASLRDVDAILHVVRCFESEDVVHTPGAPDPVRDVGIIETELLLADLETAQRGLERWSKVAKSGKTGLEERDVFARAAEVLSQGRRIESAGFSTRETEILSEVRFLTSKPCLVLANTGEDDPAGEGSLAKALVAARGETRVLPVSVRIEEEVAELPEEEQGAFLQELGLPHTALDLVIEASFRLLDLITYYTIANRKLQAWSLRRGGTAPQAAGQIHSDMEHGFIRAEVMALADLLRLGSRQALHDQGLIQVGGHDYIVRDRDVLQFHFKA